jgi:hypothetical protein
LPSPSPYLFLDAPDYSKETRAQNFLPRQGIMVQTLHKKPSAKFSRIQLSKKPPERLFIIKEKKQALSS